MRSFMVAVSASVALALGSPPMTAAATSPDDRPGLTTIAPTGPAVGAARIAARSGPEQARAALRAVRQGFRGTPDPQGRDMTMLLRDLRRGLADLPVQEREAARSLLLRPDDGPDDPEAFGYAPGTSVRNDCAVDPAGTAGSPVCVHWVTTTLDAPDLADSDGDQVPDQVELTREVIGGVWSRVVDDGGYRAPLADHSSPNGGPDERLDIYLADLGDERLYGYCTTDDPDLARHAVSAYCVLDDDYAAAQFGGVPEDTLRVTAAHEFFHAVQFAYDSYEDAWLLEGTAAWVEDELFDAVDDNRQYLVGSPLTHPSVPMDALRFGDTEVNAYGSWIFWRFLSERFPDPSGGLPVVVRDLFDAMAGRSADQGGRHSLAALESVLSDRRTTFPQLFAEFGVANRRPGNFYSEGAAYPTALPAARGKVSRRERVRLFPAQLSNETVRVAPARKLRGKGWKLRIALDLPKRRFGYAAAVTTVAKDGTASSSLVRLAADGDAKGWLPFNTRQVRYVEVTVTNASTRYDCWVGTGYSCGGWPKDAGRRVRLTFTPFR